MYSHIYTFTSLIRNRCSENKSMFCCFIEMQKAFDWVDRDLSFFKLLEYNIDVKIYNCIKAMYNHPLSCVKLNSNVTDWFSTENGVCQGDFLWPTLVAIFINDLASEMKQRNIGIDIENGQRCILLFADDIVILAEDERSKLNIVPNLNWLISPLGLGKHIYLYINEQMNCNSSQYNKLIWLWLWLWLHYI